MFDLTIAGKGAQQIAEILEGEKVLHPTAVSDIRRGMTPRKEPYRWNNNTVRMMPVACFNPEYYMIPLVNINGLCKGTNGGMILIGRSRFSASS